MEASHVSSCKLSWMMEPNSMGLQYCRRRTRTRGRNNNTLIIRAKSSGRREEYGGGEGKSVDESMIVLRMRIREMKKKLEMNQSEPPVNWMDWEKKCYSHYDEDVCNAIGLLQNYLMVTRPSVALAMLTLVAFSVPLSSAMIFFHVLQLAKRILSS